MSEGALFRGQAGADWARAPVNVRNRFEHDPLPGEIVRYRGVMSRVQCSAVGKVLGWLVQHTGALMPHEGRDVPVEIEVWTDGGVVHKRRTYFFSGNRPFVFRSRMLLTSEGKIAEHIGGGLGMYVNVSAETHGLTFTDGGYFIRLGRKLLPLPKLLSPGRVLLTHRDVSPTAFDITIDITHRIWGGCSGRKGGSSMQTQNDSPRFRCRTAEL